MKLFNLQISNQYVDQLRRPTQYFFSWLTAVTSILQPLSQGYSGTFTVAKITDSGTTGMATYVNGVLTSYTPPT